MDRSFHASLSYTRASGRAHAAYNTSASFLAWLLDTYGADKLRQIYGAPSRAFADRVNAVYGRPLESLEADWLRFCDAWAGRACPEMSGQEPGCLT